MRDLRLILACWLIERAIKTLPKLWRTKKNLINLIASGAIALQGGKVRDESEMPTGDPTFCECKELWEDPCKCPEKILERFSEEEVSSYRVFYFEDFERWMIKEFGTYDSELGDKVLNREGVMELGTDTYKTPYE